MHKRNLRELIIGSPIPTEGEQKVRLNLWRALAMLSPDALSSIAYANQEIYLGLVVAGAAGLTYSFPIALTITALLALLTLSYIQTIKAYPSGGGSYAVASENLGEWPGLVAAAALLVDYVLTAAVSLTAGVATAISTFPALEPNRVALALVLLLIIMLANLRGVRETGNLLSLPVGLFVLCTLLLVAVGLSRLIVEGPVDHISMDIQVAPLQAVTVLLILHTFASGCTALTGIEAISNGIGIFREPPVRRATQAMAIMGGLMAILFLGTVGLSQAFGIVPTTEETVLSVLTRHVLGDGVLYYIVQLSMLLVLLVAANTSFAGFPRITSILAQHGYLPRQLRLLGDRLVYSNGILLLTIVAGALIVLFSGDTHALIPLFAVGVFLAFTLSQTGMVLHWHRVREKNWILKGLLNGVGAMATAVAFAVILITKFIDGAWIVGILIALLLITFRRIKRHYVEVADELSLGGLPPDLQPLPEPRVVVPVASLHRGVLVALRYAMSISSQVIAVYIELDPAQTENVRAHWKRWGIDVPLVIIPSPYRSFIRPFLDFLDQADLESHDGQLASVVLPEFIPAKWWENLLHNQTAWLIKIALLYRRRRFGKIRAIIDIPYHLRH
jgi:amino acid transporter